MIYLVAAASGIVAGALFARFEARRARRAARRELLELIERHAARTGDARVKLFARAFANHARGFEFGVESRGTR